MLTSLRTLPNLTRVPVPDSSARPAGRLSIPLTRRGWPELVLLALIHRAIIAAWTCSVGADSVRYLPAAELYQDGRYREGLETILHPLYPLLSGLLARLTGSVELSAVLVAVGAAALVPLPLYLLVKNLWNERVAWVAGFLYALHPTLASDTSEAYPTALFLLLFFSSAACAVHAVTTPRWYLFPLAGALASLCYLTRTEGVHAALFAGGSMVWFSLWAALKKRNPPDGGPRSREGLRHAAGILTCGIVFILVALPYLGFVREKLGRWGFTLKGGQTLLDKAISVEDVEEDPAPAAAGTAADAIGSHSSVWRYMGKKASRALFGPLIPFFLLGFFCVRRQGGEGRRLLPLGAMALIAFIPPLLLLTLTPNHKPDHRYMLLSGMLLLPWAGAAILTIGDHLTADRRPPLLREWGWAAILAFFLVLLPIKSLGPRRASERTLVAAGAWLREQPLGEKRILVSSNPKLSYYGRCVHVVLPSPRQDAYAPPPGRDGGPDAEKLLEWSRRARKEFDRTDGSLLAVDEKVLKDYFGPGYLKQLEAVGFRSKKTVSPEPGEKAITVWFFAVDPP